MLHVNRKSLVSLFLVTALALGAFAFPVVSGAQDKTMSAQDFHDAMRKLWEDHITWTRLYIVSFAADLPDKDAVATRLLKNQEDIGDAIRPIYGDDAADKLTQLLKDHITGAVDLLTAAKAGDSAATKTASDKWYANADAIATFLNSANPDNWPLDDLKAEMKMHLDLTLAEATAHLGGDAEKSIAAYDDVHNEILEMADMLSSGIIKQFPDRFPAAAQS
jgi:hypothetical protein